MSGADSGTNAAAWKIWQSHPVISLPASGHIANVHSPINEILRLWSEQREKHMV